MTIPFRPVALALLLAPFAVGCGEKTTEDTDTDTDTEFAGTEAPDYFEPDFFLVDGLIGYDSVNSQVRSYLTPGQEDGVPPNMEIRLFKNGEYDPQDDFTYCSVVFLADALIPTADWVTDANAPEGRSLDFGFTFPESTQVGSTCADFDFDPDVWGDSDDPALDAILLWDWGFGIGEDLDAAGANAVLDSLEEAVLDQLSAEEWTADFEPFVFNGFVHWSAVIGQEGFEGGAGGLNYATGVAVDENFVLAYDDENSNGSWDAPTDAAEGEPLTNIMATEVLDGDAPSGAYILSSWFILPAECLMGIEFCPQ